MADRSWANSCCEGADEVECSNFVDAVAEMCRELNGVFVASRLCTLLCPDTQRLMKHGVKHPDPQVAATAIQLVALLLGSSEAVSALAEGTLAEGALQRGVLLECALQRTACGNPQAVRRAAMTLGCVALAAHTDFAALSRLNPVFTKLQPCVLPRRTPLQPCNPGQPCAIHVAPCAIPAAPPRRPSQVGAPSRRALHALLRTAMPPHAVLTALEEPALACLVLAWPWP